MGQRVISTTQIGAHVSASGGLSKSVERARIIGAECLQLFLCAPQQWRAPNHADAEVDGFLQLARFVGIGPNFVHAIYLINLASPDPVLRSRSVEALAANSKWASRCGLDGTVVHVGSAKGQPIEEAERCVAEALGQVREAHPEGMLVLENSAGAGNTLGARFAQIGQLLAAVDHDPRVGVCLDTAHAFASGYDIRTKDGLDIMLEELDRHIGSERILLVHANDSKSGLGSALDRHENIGEGQIGDEAFQRMLEHPLLRQVPWILEVPGSGKGPDLANIQALRRLAGRPPYVPE